MAKQVKEEELSQEDCNRQKKFTVPKFGSLKEILEELGKLHNTTYTRHKVFLQLRDGLGAYCGNGYLEAFYKDLVEGSDHRLGVSSYGSGSILLLTQAAERISEAILKSTPWTSQIQDTHAKHDDCIKKYAEALQACLPKTFAALLFLFFNVSNDCKGFGGGQWNSYSVKGSGASGQNLKNWLTESSDSDLPGGFSKEELHGSKTGNNVADPLKKAVSLTPNTDYGSLQNVLCGFMFVCDWHDALTGHAICFLSTFCSKVLGDSERFLQEPYKDHSGAFKEVCRGLKSDLQPFIGGSSGLSAVCHGNTNLFESLWDDGKFDKYCDWLKGNLHSVIGALQTMPMESPGWSLSSLQSGGNAGPFKYGFVFTDNDWDGKINSKLEGPIKNLLSSLESLDDCVHDKSSGNPAATAGGVFTGLFGLGGAGAGAAYATNAFGFQNFITGLISGFLK